jgi:hypothetical protein
MKGDYHRYLAEFKTNGDRKEAAESTLMAYKAAQARAHATAGRDRACASQHALPRFGSGAPALAPSS